MMDRLLLFGSMTGDGTLVKTDAVKERHTKSAAAVVKTDVHSKQSGHAATFWF